MILAGFHTLAPGLSRITALLGGLVLIAGLASVAHAAPGPEMPVPPSGAYGQWPLSFEVNRGQADPQAEFLARGRGYGFYLCPGEAILALSKPSPSKDKPHHGRAAQRRATIEPPALLHMQFAGANLRARMVGEDEFPGKVNYLLGNDPAGWQRNVPTFARVRYEDLYSGVDLVCYGRAGRLEYDFIVAPGTSPDVISLCFQGLDRLEIDPGGDLLLHTVGGVICQHQPCLYQIADGVRKEITGAYYLKDPRTVGFRADAYDSSRALVIDPVLSYSTYLGGGALDSGWAIAVDAAGSAYLAGESLSLLTNLVTPGAFQTNYAGGTVDRTNYVGGDALVAKVNPAGSGLVYLTYLGGSGDEAALGIALDSLGNACLTGYTDSTNFPTTFTAIRHTIHGPQDFFSGLFPLDAFVAKLDASGSALLYSTYLGGDGADEGIDIAVDGAGMLYVAGFSASTNFPVTLNALQTRLNNVVQNFGTVFNPDAFAAKIDPSLPGIRALVYSTFLGNSGIDEADGIAVDGAGNAYLTGLMDVVGQPNLLNWPLYDAFVAKLDPTGSSLVYGHLLHGSSNDIAFHVAVDAEGSAYVTGSTDSGDFPATPNGLNPGGAFKSADAGGSWNASSVGLSRAYIGSLALDPTVPSTIYAGTFGGVYKSADGGATWFGNGDALNYFKFTNSITVTNGIGYIDGIAFTNGLPFTNGVAFTNGLSYWAANSASLGYRMVAAIAVDPLKPSTLYAGTAGAGVFKSLDGGVSWFTTNGGLYSLTVNALLMDPFVRDTLYAGTSSGLFKSYSGFTNWVASSVGLPNPNVRAIVASPSGAILYAGSAGGVGRSNNRGTNWVAYNRGLLNLSVNTLAVDPTTPNTVYAGTAGGMFKSVNGATNWVAINSGIGPRDVLALALDPSNPVTLYAGTTNGLFKTSDAGASWVLATNGLNTTNIAALAIDPGSPGTVYAGTGTTNAVGVENCFVTKLRRDGSGIVYSAVLGRSGLAQGWDLAVDAGGNAYVVGTTASNSFPVVQAPSLMQTTNSGGNDAVVFELDPSGSALVYSFYVGGRGDDAGHGIALDSVGNVYMIGTTASTNFPTISPLQAGYAGGVSDVFVTKILAQPKLLVARSGNSLVLSWPAPSPEFVLEVNHNGMLPNDWSPVPQIPSVIEGRKTVTVDVSAGHQTFRLKRQ